MATKRAYEQPRTARLGGECTIRPATPADFPAIVSLVGSVFGNAPTVDEFAAIHLENPAGPSLLYVAESADGDIVAHRGLLRSDIYYRGRRLRSAQGSLTATHPAFRGRGLFSRMSHASNEQFFEQGGDIVCSFPGPDTARISIRDLGFTLVGSIRHAVFPIGSTWPADRLPVKVGVGVHNLLFRRTAKSVAAPIESAVLPDRDPETPRAQFARSAAHQAWLFGKRGRQYHLIRVSGVEGAAVVGSITRRGRRACTVVELQCDDARAASRLLAAVPGWAAKQGYELVFTWLKDPRWAYLRSGYIPMRSAVPVMVRLRDERMYPELKRRIDSWDLSLLDADAY